MAHVRLGDPHWRDLHWHRADLEPLALPLHDLPLDQIRIEDIASALAQINRWGGRVPVPYDVARHSTDVAHLAYGDGMPRPFVYECLMHDTTEAITGDVPSPIKDLIPAFRELEHKIRPQLARRFCFAAVEPPGVKRYDNLAADRELQYVRSPHARARDWTESRDAFLRWYDLLAPARAPR